MKPSGKNIKIIAKKWRAVIFPFTLLLIIGAVFLLNDHIEEPNPNPVYDQQESEELVPVTDPEILSYLWEEYLFDAITTICNQPFASIKEVDRNYAIQYAVNVMCRKGIYEKLDNEWGRIDPQTVSEYIQIYLNTTVNDIVPARDFTFTGYYNSEMDAFCIDDISFSIEKDPGYNERNAWGIKMASVMKNEYDHTYTVKLLHFASAQSQRITEETICVLKERPDGTMHFVSIVDTFPNKDALIVINGNHKKLDPSTFKITPANKQWPFKIMKNDKSNLFVHSENGREGSNYQNHITVYDEKTFHELASFESDKQFLSVKTTQYGYMIISSSNILKIDPDFKVIENLSIPRQVMEGAFQNDWRGGLDVSEDSRFFVYSSKDQGLMLYDTNNRTAELLSPHLPENSKLFYTPYITGPAFVDHDQKVAAKIVGYESIGGYIMADLKTGQIKQMNNEITYDNIQSFDSDLSAAYGISHRENIDDNERKVYITRLDYALMEMVPVKAAVIDDVQTYPDSEWSPFVYNHKYLSYVSSQYSQTGDHADHIYHLVQVDLDTMKAETLLSIKAAYPNILGILEDGRVLFSYNFENETGLGITGN